ncbi:hypothetical protein DFH29DRAFT_770405, partial [Suillus ampliporus]
GFWFMHLAPILLKDYFPNTKYYDHMCRLMGIMKTMLKFKLTHNEIDTFDTGLTDWVETYEKCVMILHHLLYYYQYLEEQLSECTLPIHGLLY